MNLVALEALADGFFLLIVGFLCGFALRKALLGLVLVYFAIVLVGYLQLSAPFDAVRVMGVINAGVLMLFLGLHGIAWAWVVGGVVGFFTAHYWNIERSPAYGGMS